MSTEHTIAHDAEAARYAKARKGEVLTEEEFLAEAGFDPEDPKARYALEVYRRLVHEYRGTPLSGWDVWQFAHYKWCFSDPTAMRFKRHRNEWLYNTCTDLMNAEKAIILVNREFCFEASRIQLAGSAYYGATDHNWVEFSVGGYDWVMHNGDLYRV